MFKGATYDKDKMMVHGHLYIHPEKYQLRVKNDPIRCQNVLME